ncbi:unnamed protein product, partial [Rotaria sordida]
GNGQGSALNQLNGPNSVYYDYLGDNGGSLFIADSGNNRILKFPAGSTQHSNGTVVAGGNGPGSEANQLYDPRYVLVDSTGVMFISDGNNNRIQRWLPSATSGETILGSTIVADIIVSIMNKI